MLFTMRTIPSVEDFALGRGGLWIEGNHSWKCEGRARQSGVIEESSTMKWEKCHARGRDEKRYWKREDSLRRTKHQDRPS